MGPEERLLRSRITRERYPVVEPDVEKRPTVVETIEAYEPSPMEKP